MTFWETLKASVLASLVLSWIAALISCVPSVGIALIARTERRFGYLLAGLAGGLMGEISGVSSLFFGFYLDCRHQVPCNTAQGDMGLVVALPIGTLAGCGLSLVSLRWWYSLAKTAHGRLRPMRLFLLLSTCWCLITTLLALWKA